MKRIVDTVSNLNFDLRYISDIANSTPGCLRADIGNVNYPIDSSINKLIYFQTQNNNYDYSPTFGENALIKSLELYESEMLLQFKDPRILITSGGQAALYASLASLVKPGDKVLTDNYYYPPYSNLIKLLMGVQVSEEITTLPEKNLSDINILLLNSPNNPTGRIYGKNTLKRIALLARKYDWIVIEDIVYNKIYFDKKPKSISQYCPERTLIINSASKNFCMPGIRIGWIFGPNELVSGIAKLHRNMNSCPNSIFQKVLAEFIPKSGNFLDSMRNEMIQRKNLLLKSFDRLGWKYIVPDGGIYVIVKIENMKDSVKFVRRMITKAGVSAMPGIYFGNHPDVLRFCFGALTKANIENLEIRLKTFI